MVDFVLNLNTPETSVFYVRDRFLTLAYAAGVARALHNKRAACSSNRKM